MGCGCLLMPFQVVGRFLRWCLENRWKGLIVLVIVVIVLVVLGFQIKGMITKATNPDSVFPYSATVPSVQQAPYIVITESRYYFAREVSKENGITTMVDYWELIGKKWVLQKSTLILGPEFGTTSLRKR